MCVQLNVTALGEDRLNAITQLGDRLLSDTAVPDREVLRQQLVCANMTWRQLSADITEHCRQCQEQADAVRMFTDCLAHLNASLDESDNQLRLAENCHVVTFDDRRDQLKSLKVC